MRRWSLVAGVLVALSGTLAAQEDSLERVNQDVRAVFAAARKSGGNPDAAQVAAIVGRLLDLGTDQKGSDEGLQANALALQLVDHVEGEKQLALFTEVMDGIVADYLNHEQMPMILVGYLKEKGGDLGKKVDDYLDWIARDATSDSVNCAAAFCKLTRSAAGEIDAETRKRIVAGLKELQAKYGELVGPMGPWNATLEREIRDLELFHIGAVAPEISGKDLDDVDFKLSDYRGKVVLLDFWGFW
jgi:hypothetical protein